MNSNNLAGKKRRLEATYDDDSEAHSNRQFGEEETSNRIQQQEQQAATTIQLLQHDQHHHVPSLGDSTTRQVNCANDISSDRHHHHHQQYPSPSASVLSLPNQASQSIYQDPQNIDSISHHTTQPNTTGEQSSAIQNGASQHDINDSNIQTSSMLASPVNVGHQGESISQATATGVVANCSNETGPSTSGYAPPTQGQHEQHPTQAAPSQTHQVPASSEHTSLLNRISAHQANLPLSSSTLPFSFNSLVPFPLQMMHPGFPAAINQAGAVLPTNPPFFLTNPSNLNVSSTQILNHPQPMSTMVLPGAWGGAALGIPTVSPSIDSNQVNGSQNSTTFSGEGQTSESTHQVSVQQQPSSQMVSTAALHNFVNTTTLNGNNTHLPAQLGTNIAGRISTAPFPSMIVPQTHPSIQSPYPLLTSLPQQPIVFLDSVGQPIARMPAGSHTMQPATVVGSTNAVLPVTRGQGGEKLSVINKQPADKSSGNYIPISGNEASSSNSSNGTVKPLYMPCDNDILCSTQILLRQQLEFFEARQLDIETLVSGRRRPIVLGQVGVRCRHCSHIQPKSRKKGNSYYPSRLESIYQAAQNICSSHLCDSCQHVDQWARSRLLEYQTTKTRKGYGGKNYWAQAAQALGIVQTENHGLRYTIENETAVDEESGEANEQDV